MSLKSLVNQCGTRFIPGTRSKLYLTIKGELNGWPQNKQQLGGAEAGDTKILGEAFDFSNAPAGSGYWREFDILVDTGNVVDTLEGEIGGQAMVNRLGFFVLGNDAKRKEFADLIMQFVGCLIAMIPDKNGQYHVVGNLDDPCYVETLEGGSGTVPGDRVGFQYGLYANTGVTSMLYDATLGIDTEPNV